MSVKIFEKDYKNFGNCLFMENDSASLGVTIDRGPRVIYFALKGKQNIMLEDEARRFCEDVGEYGTWFNCGGHRLWVAPEYKPETYSPDNDRVKYTVNGSTVTFTPAATPFGKQLSIEITLDESKPVAKLTHSITNVSDKPSEYAAWSITGLCAGGVLKIPVCIRKTGFLPNRVISLWDYASLTDPRLKITDTEVRLRQDKFIKGAFKAGFNNEDGFAAYAANEQIFVKSFADYEFVKYPDYSCNFETYTNDAFIECEVLGEMRSYAPNESAVISECWTLLENPDDNEPELDKVRAAIGK